MIHTYPTATPRQKKRDATFERIIEAAMQALARGGLDALTMQHLAGELGFAVGALYRYFPSKDAILVAVQLRLVDSLHRELVRALGQADQQVAARADLDPRRAALLRLWVLAQLYESMAREQPTEFCLLSMTISDPRQLVKDEHASLLLPSLLGLLQLVGGLFQDAAATGALGAGDPARRTVVLWTAVQGALQLRKLERFGVGALSVAAVLDEAVTTLLVGWGAGAEDTRDMQRCAQQCLGAAVPGRSDSHSIALTPTR